jgi:hypothetical protein
MGLKRLFTGEEVRESVKPEEQPKWKQPIKYTDDGQQTKRMKAVTDPVETAVKTAKHKVEEFVEPARQGIQDVFAGVGGAMDKVVGGAKDYVSEGHKAIQEGRRQDTSWDEVVLGATPVLTGLLTGEWDTAFQAGSEALLKDQEQQFELEKRRAAASEKTEKPQLTDILDPKGSGKKVKAWAYPGGRIESTGVPSSFDYESKADIRKEKDMEKYLSKGQNFIYKQDQVTGRDYRIDKITGRRHNITMPSGYLDKKQNSVIKEFSNKADDFKKDEIAYKDLRESANLLGKGVLQNKMAVMGIVKKIENRLSDADRDYYTKPIGTLRSLREKMKQEKSGKMRPELIKEAKDLLNRLMDSQRDFLKKSYDRIYETGSKRSGIDKEKFKEYIGSSAVLETHYIVRNPKTNEAIAVPMDKISKQELESDGFIVEGMK